ncbi:WD40 repeat-like protein [Auriscalpium vulgare]|uniref:WD40 repeat-like protein n=1 Tax=Auriscalpium vulgare TaxID=40419 RepID=A0ACB8RAW1_9AGAM|nr:WD40 repeat-like protein [Auriscalpium vulgare]
MEASAYFPSIALQNQHTRLISCLAFSERGNMMLSGDDGGQLIVWDAITGNVLYRTFFPSEVTCGIWLSSRPHQIPVIFCGTRTGSAVVISDFKQYAREVLTGCIGPVYAAEFDTRTEHLAIAVGEEVHVASQLEGGTWATSIILPRPKAVFLGDHHDISYLIRARGLHFYSHGSSLIVTYLHHGIVCWDLNTRSQAWSIPIRPLDTRQVTIDRLLIGFSAISADHRLLSLSNLRSGSVDVYELKTLSLIRSLAQRVAPSLDVLVAVLFLGKHPAVICGSTVGDVHIWNVDSGRPIQVLTHDGELSLSARMIFASEKLWTGQMVQLYR